jgi:hypothetical protein
MEYQQTIHILREQLPMGRFVELLPPPPPAIPEPTTEGGREVAKKSLIKGDAGERIVKYVPVEIAGLPHFKCWNSLENLP